MLSGSRSHDRGGGREGKKSHNTSKQKQFREDR
jgi:hypothetical protein